MKKSFMTAVLAGLIAVSINMTAFAGQWQQDTKGWWYQNDDGSFLKDGWKWVDGKCYYFTSDGYCLTGTQTPDGYTVDASGAWIVDGVVQTQDGGFTANADPNSFTVGTLTFVMPDGFTKYAETKNSVDFASYDPLVLISVSSQGQTQATAEIQQMATPETDILLDHIATNTFGGTATGANLQLGNCTWRFYEYPNIPGKNLPGQMQVYVRLAGNHLDMIMFFGEISGVDTASIMQNNLR